MIVNEELEYVLETIRFKTSIYRDKKKRNLSFNDDDYYSNILNEYITDLQQENARLKDKINMAIKYYELNQQECVIGRNKDDKLIKEYYLPAQCSEKILDILKEN